MESFQSFFEECESHIDKYLDYAPIFDSQVLWTSQQMLLKLENIQKNEQLKNLEKSKCLYLCAGLQMIKDSPHLEIESNLLKSVFSKDQNKPKPTGNL